MTYPATSTPTGSSDQRMRAAALCTAVARATGEVPATARLHCLAAVEGLDLPADFGVYLAHQRQVLQDQPPERLLRAALNALGSLPPQEFTEVRTAAVHARRALRALS